MHLKFLKGKDEELDKFLDLLSELHLWRKKSHLLLMFYTFKGLGLDLKSVDDVQLVEIHESPTDYEISINVLKYAADPALV